MTLVALTDGDRSRARACAEKRVSDARAAGARDRFGPDSIEAHYWGALGELAVALLIDEAWNCSSRVWAARDVGRYEVRSVGPRSRFYVKAKANDPPDRAIAVVRFRADTEAEVLGWTYASTVREKGHREDPGGRGAPAYFVRDQRLLTAVFPEAPTKGHVHGYAKDAQGWWICWYCPEPYIGPVPPDALHPDGWQGARP